MRQPSSCDPILAASGAAPVIASRTSRGPLIYDLRIQPSGSQGYTADVAVFSERVIREIELRAGDALDGYCAFVRNILGEASRSRGEYALEMLTLGMVVELYVDAAATTPGWAVALAAGLLWLRHRSQTLKPVADLARASILRARRPLPTGNPLPVKFDSLPRLLRWLRATGEFDQEAVRLAHWQAYLATLPPPEANHTLQQSLSIFRWFAGEAAPTLGPYTEGVAAFLAGPYSRRGVREDQLFCAKRPVEYHLGMVAADVMNRGLRPHFDQTARKALLVPTCMRGAHAATCRARSRGLDIVCTGCDPDCAVHRITRRMRAYGVPVYLVPHATGFSRWLKRWQSEPDVGVVAVACILNILPGGYEMRARSIPSQCVPLDHPGCDKHWCTPRIPTSVDESRLVQIVTGSCPSFPVDSAQQTARP